MWFVRPDERATLFRGFGVLKCTYKIKRGIMNTCKLAIMQRGERENYDSEGCELKKRMGFGAAVRFLS